jgi:hypothetical protein
MTDTNDATALTAESFVESLAAREHHLCMGLGRRAPKGELGVSKDDGTDAAPEILAQFQNLPRAHVWIAALAQADLTAALSMSGELGIATPIGSKPDGETLEYWLRNLPSDFQDEIVAELRTRRMFAMTG